VRRTKTIGAVAGLIALGALGAGAYLWFCPGGQARLLRAILSPAEFPPRWRQWAVRRAVEVGDPMAIEAAILHPAPEVSLALYRSLPRIERADWARLVAVVMQVSAPAVQILQARLLVESDFAPNLWALARLMEQSDPEISQAAIQLWSEILILHPDWLERERLRSEHGLRYELERISQGADGQVAALCLEILQELEK